MAVAQRLRVTCPRCASPVTGDFKYCPACAFRLKQGATAEAPPPPAHRTLSAWLLGLGATAVLGGLVAVGVVLFRDPTQTTRRPKPALPLVSAASMSIATLPTFLRTVGEGIADWALDQVDGQDGSRPRWVRPLRVMAFEVTRLLYAEYLTGLREQVERGQGPGETLSQIWQAKTEAEQLWAQDYLQAWLEAFVRHAKTAGLSQEEAMEPLLQYVPEQARSRALRPEDVAHKVPFPWPHELGLVVAGPPAWASVNPFGLVVSALPPGTEHLPVTGVAWSDAVAFAFWAQAELGGDVGLRLPLEGEWLRIAHGGHPIPPVPPDEIPDPDTLWLWPWGSEPLVRACNNRQFWPPGYPPELQRVDYRYLDEGPNREVLGDQTTDGIFGMAGNAREWVARDRFPPLRVGKSFQVTGDDDERSNLRALTCGGSYLRGIHDCTVNSRVEEDKTARREDLGFRLVANALPY